MAIEVSAEVAGFRIFYTLDDAGISAHTRLRPVSISWDRVIGAGLLARLPGPDNIPDIHLSPAALSRFPEGAQLAERIREGAMAMAARDRLMVGYRDERSHKRSLELFVERSGPLRDQVIAEFRRRLGPSWWEGELDAKKASRRMHLGPSLFTEIAIVVGLLVAAVLLLLAVGLGHALVLVMSPVGMVQDVAKGDYGLFLVRLTGLFALLTVYRFWRNWWRRTWLEKSQMLHALAAQPAVPPPGPTA